MSQSHIGTVILDDVDEAIQRSRYMLDWPENWDSENSPIYTESTWIRATEFARNAMRAFRTDHSHSLHAPRIVTGADGSIDLRWKNDTRQLVINIPPTKGEVFAYYGRDAHCDDLYISGTLRPSDNADLFLLWLVQQ